MKRGKNISSRGRGSKEAGEKRRAVVGERKVVRKEKMSGDLIGRYRMRHSFFSPSFSSLLSTREEEGRVGRMVGYSSIGLLSLIMLSLLFPLAPSTSQAVTADSSNPITDGARLKAETYVYSTLAISLSESVNLDVVPKAGGSFTTGGAELNITTNNTTGYAVFLQTGDNTSTLRPANGMVDARIKPVVGEMNESNFQQNLDTWGYAIGQADTSLSSMNYKAVPMASSPAVITTDSLAAKDNYTLGFAASVSPSLPAGKYYNSVLVSVVANPIAVHTLSGITYMQEMSPYVCDYSDEHETKQLIDTRDGKSYWVAKLKDGNCWMVQNLALDLSTEVALTPADSDVSSDWTPKSNTETEIPAKTTADYTSERSWNLGNIVLTNPTKSTICAQELPSELAGQGYTQDGFNSTFYGYKITEQCGDLLKDISNNMLAGFSATETSSISPDGKSYDAHYLIGNYYTWNAATAGSGVNISSPNSASTNLSDLVDANDSICPRGWRLPTDGRYYNGGIAYPFERDNSFVKLLVAYGYPAGNAEAGWSIQNGTPYTSITGTGKTRLDFAPMYFMRNGHVSPTIGAFRDAGRSSSYWSSTATPNSNNIYALDLSFDWTVVFVSNSNSRYNGFPMRCVAK